MYICEVIWENPAYGGTKRTGADQMPLRMCFVKSEPGLFVTYEYLQKTLFSLSEICNKSPRAQKR